MGKQGLTDTDLLRRIAAVFSGQTQVDAAAKVEDDDERYSGGGARAKEGLWEKEGEEWGRPAVPIYKEIGEQAGAKKEEGQNDEYPAN